MIETNINQILETYARTLPRFPDGRIDYSSSDSAPILSCIVTLRGKVLILKRSDQVSHYQGLWDVVIGYLDDFTPLPEKALEELYEETGIAKENVSEIMVAEPYESSDAELQKTWFVHPVLVELEEEPEITLDWEHTEFCWIDPEEVANYETFSELPEVLGRVLHKRTCRCGKPA